MINILDKQIADKIAAGEVIERPVSIIKELVENSIDAGADSIVVEIRKGGKSYIRVSDNGCGMSAEDAEKAFPPRYQQNFNGGGSGRHRNSRLQRRSPGFCLRRHQN